MLTLLMTLQLIAFGLPVVEGPTSADAVAITVLNPQNKEVPATPIVMMWDAVPNANGYVLYVGTTDGVYTQRVVVGAPTSFVYYPGAGTWHVAVAAYREIVPGASLPTLRAPGKPRVKQED